MTLMDKEMETAEPPPEDEGEQQEVLPAISYGNRVHLEEVILPQGITIAPPPHVFNPNSNGDPRLIITHIVNLNFKSYSGRQVLGPFHKSFSGIVGPNGSGKSNVIDSMLFVFGFRANKIRSKKISVLIHNSENHKDAQSCTVEVHFEKIVDLEDGGYCSIPDSSFYVARTAYRDNTSQYFINKKKVQFKHVASLLEESGIDLNHNRFLILQGEVEQIALMKPIAKTEHGDGMLEFLEDIIGSIRYKEPIEKMQKEIEELDEERKDSLSRVKVVEKEKEKLEPIRKEAIDYLQKKNEKTHLENKLIQYNLKILCDEEEEDKKLTDKINEEISTIETSLKESKAEKSEKNKEVSKVFKALEKNSYLLTELKDKMRDLEKLNVEIFEDRKHKKAKLKALAKKLEKDKSKLGELKSLPENLESKIENLLKEQTDLTQDRKEAETCLQKTLQDFKEETKALQEQKEELVQVLLSKTDDVNTAKQKLDVATVQMELFESNFKKAQSALQQCVQQVEEVTEKEQLSKSRLAEVTEHCKQLEEKLHQHTERLSGLKLEEKELLTQTKKLQSTVSEAKYSRQATQSRGAVHGFLLKLKQSGKLPGIHGRLGDLGAIDKKYDVAISSCCGALENMVVDTVETAQACIRALKENNVGRTTFIVLEKMRDYEQQAHQVPHDVPLKRLIDLVQSRDPKYLGAFFFALRNTLVADTLAIATKVAYGKQRRWRVVTLQGELVDTSGTMSGGGTKVIRGRMGANCVRDDGVSDAKLQEMQQNCDASHEQLKQVQHEIVKCEDTIKQVRHELQRANPERKRLEMDIKNNAAMVEDLKRKLPVLRRGVVDAKPNKEEEKKMQQDVDSLKKDYDKAFKKADVVEKKKQALDDEINCIQDQRLRPKQEWLKKLESQIDGVSTSISKNKVAVTTAKRNFAKCEKAVESAEQELAGGSDVIAELEKNWKQLEVDGATVMEKIAEAEAEAQTLNEEAKEKQMFVKKVEKTEEVIAEKLKEVKKSFEQSMKSSQARREKIKDKKSKLSKLKLHAIDSEDVGSLDNLSAEELEDVCEDELQAKITLLENETAQMQPNMRAIEEYKQKQTVYLERVSELDGVTQKRDKYRNAHDNLHKRRLNEFSEGFAIITNKLKEIYQMITLGGDAELEFVDSLDPFSEGIIFSVRPPKKSWKSICNLSGGEKTLSSLALIFALHHYRPTPLYVMDEIDAALDFKNVTIIAQYIVERTKNAQFIVISLRNNMFEVANRLVGIYKTDNCTKSATIEPSLISNVIVAATQQQERSQ